MRCRPATPCPPSPPEPLQHRSLPPHLKPQPRVQRQQLPFGPQAVAQPHPLLPLLLTQQRLRVQRGALAIVLVLLLLLLLRLLLLPLLLLLPHPELPPPLRPPLHPLLLLLRLLQLALQRCVPRIHLGTQRLALVVQVPQLAAP